MPPVRFYGECGGQLGHELTCAKRLLCFVRKLQILALFEKQLFISQKEQNNRTTTVNNRRTVEPVPTVLVPTLSEYRRTTVSQYWLETA